MVANFNFLLPERDVWENNYRKAFESDWWLQTLRGSWRLKLLNETWKPVEG